MTLFCLLCRFQPKAKNLSLVLTLVKLNHDSCRPYWRIDLHESSLAGPLLLQQQPLQRSPNANKCVRVCVCAARKAPLEPSAAARSPFADPSRRTISFYEHEEEDDDGGGV